MPSHKRQKRRPFRRSTPALRAAPRGDRGKTTGLPPSLRSENPVLALCPAFLCFVGNHPQNGALSADETLVSPGSSSNWCVIEDGLQKGPAISVHGFHVGRFQCVACARSPSLGHVWGSVARVYCVSGAGVEKGRGPAPQNRPPCATAAQVITPKSFLRRKYVIPAPTPCDTCARVAWLRHLRRPVPEP